LAKFESADRSYFIWTVRLYGMVTSSPDGAAVDEMPREEFPRAR
jgi:hypothetical protein